MAIVDFWKYEGTANDFVLLESDDPNADIDPATVAKLCDRHRGIGGDGVLLVTPAPEQGSGVVHGRMVVRNADGSRPEMCGNGLRCVALHVATRRADPGILSIMTDAGLRTCKVEMGSEHDFWVTVEMGMVTVGETVQVPFHRETIELVKVDAGNPHAVAFDLGDDDLDGLGAQLQMDMHFPGGVNLERVSLQSQPAGATVTAGVTVFERGVGRTMACGTGACAVAAALVARGVARRGDKTVVVLPGGPLEIVIDAEGRASMRGQARRVFAGRVTLPDTALK
ncbi:MAG: diaminopimelate epimerase [Polyangiales bacterium]